MPPELDAMAKTLWRRLSKALDDMGVLTTNDGEALGRYCVTLARWRRLQRVIRKEGETFKTLTTAGHPTIKVRPEVGIVKGLAMDLAKLEAQFGLTPSARASLDVTAIFTHGRKTDPDSKPKPPGAGDPTAPTANVIQGKGRFFGGKPA
jgi:P27 family predicted phage terminase small subunit